MSKAGRCHKLYILGTVSFKHNMHLIIHSISQVLITKGSPADRHRPDFDIDFASTDYQKFPNRQPSNWSWYRLPKYWLPNVHHQTGIDLILTDDILYTDNTTFFFSKKWASYRLYRNRSPRIVNRTVTKIIVISVHTVNRFPLIGGDTKINRPT
jgi:hypothetical protein